MNKIKSIPDKQTEELKGPKAVKYYAVLHLPTASYLYRSIDNIFDPGPVQHKLLLFRSKEKMRRGIKLANKFQMLHTTSGEEISNKDRKYHHHFEAVSAFTLITFPDGHKLLRLYLPIELKKLLSASNLNYFESYPGRIQHENCV